MAIVMQYCVLIERCNYAPSGVLHSILLWKQFYSIEQEEIHLILLDWSQTRICRFLKDNFESQETRSFL